MRNYIRVIQYGYRDINLVSKSDQEKGRRQAIVCHEFFFDNEDRVGVEGAVAAASAFRDCLPMPRGAGKPRLVAYRPVPGHSFFALVGREPDDRSMAA